MKARGYGTENFVPSSGQIGMATGLLVVTAACLFWPFNNPEEGEEPGPPSLNAAKDGNPAVEVKVVAPKLRCHAAGCRDQADMCVWVHPTDPAQSTIIAADKKAAALFVYDLNGKVIQSIPGQRPGSVDVRYCFLQGGHSVDIVAYNERTNCKVLVYKIEVASRKLERIDNGSITTGRMSYGGTLYRSPKTGRIYYVMTSETEDTEQYELADDGSGKVAGRKVRSWRIGAARAAVADDETGNVYIADARCGVWEVGGEPDDPTPGKLIIECGLNGLQPGIQGLALYDLRGGDDYLIVANRRAGNFKLYQRQAPHQFIGTFAVEGARHGDGLEVCNANLGPRFPTGIFVCHTKDEGAPILVTPWESIVNAVGPELKVHTDWEWRTWMVHAPPPRAGER